MNSNKIYSFIFHFLSTLIIFQTSDVQNGQLSRPLLSPAQEVLLFFFKFECLYV